MARGPLTRAALAAALCLRVGQVLGSTAAPQNNLDSLVNDPKLKFVFVGGKGGVGKTTTSSAIASQLSLSLGEPSGSNKRILLISTDPAHSLSDAFRMPFSNVPTPIRPDLPNLEVMEVNPAAIMKQELSTWADLAGELGYDPGSKDDPDGEGVGEKIYSFQQWLSGVPGIDEATALSSAIEHIESGRYDMIVFDTAPTGHTLKLLELPKILQAGLDKLESWQATLWGYWEMVKGITTGGDTGGMKQKVAEKLRAYKASIGRVASMITDAEKTRFVVVCIAEYLSISESRRLLSELDRFGVPASHVVVNQLVTDYLEEGELAEFEAHVDRARDTQEGPVLSKALAAARLTSARRSIQSKYLRDLRACPEVNRLPDPEEPEVRTNSRTGSTPLQVLEVPLLPNEVTGPKAILKFSHYLVGKTIDDAAMKSVGVEGERSKRGRKDEHEAQQAAEAGAASDQGKKRKKQAKKEDGMKNVANSVIDKVMADPELAEMVTASPRLKGIVEEVKDNPMAALQYMSDPEVRPFLQKAVGKIMPGMEGLLGGGMPGGGAPGGGRKKKKKGKKGGGAGQPDLNDLLGGLGAMMGGAEL